MLRPLGRPGASIELEVKRFRVTQFWTLNSEMPSEEKVRELSELLDVVEKAGYTVKRDLLKPKRLAYIELFRKMV
jgi:hypothetical protein